MQELVDIGLLETTDESVLSVKGVAGFDQLDASGYRPTADGIRLFVDHIIPSSDPDAVVILLTDFAHNRERLQMFAARHAQEMEHEDDNRDD